MSCAAISPGSCIPADGSQPSMTANTRISIKPSHLIGGYAQLSFAFNYLGPTGNQRDMVSTVRRRSQDVRY